MAKNTIEKDKVVASKKGAATTKPSARGSKLHEGILKTFASRDDIKEVFICRSGEDKGKWYFSQRQADKYWRGNYEVVVNPDYQAG